MGKKKKTEETLCELEADGFLRDHFEEYGVLHSLLASQRAKSLARRWLGQKADRWYRLAFNGFGTITLLPVLILPGRLPDRTLYSFPSPWKYLAMAGQLAAVGVLAVTLLQTDLASFLGLRQLLQRNDTPKKAELVTSGFYRWVRHPLYTAGLFFIWLTPVMSQNLLALYLGFTAYLIIGARFEERRLEREFGEAYAAYREQTPMLFPGLKINRSE